MGLVDNVILSFSMSEAFEEQEGIRVRVKDGYPIMREVNAWLREHAGQRQEFGPDLGSVEESFGGAKPLETPIFVGAFNYLPLSEFAEFLATLPWDRPESVQLIVKAQQSDVFEFVPIGEADHGFIPIA